MREKITPLCLLLEDPEDARLPPAEDEDDEEEGDGDDEGSGARARKKFDLVTSHLVLHHIADVRGVLATMRGCLRPGSGEVALTDYADFGPDARRFHPEARMGGVEHPRGIGPRWLEGVMREVGLAGASVDGAAWTMEKEVERWPGEWGGLDGGEMKRGRRTPGEGEGEGEGGEGDAPEVMGFPFLLARGKREA